MTNLVKNIYLVTIPEKLIGYDCYGGHVVYAKGPKEAKKICSSIHADEGAKVRIELSIAVKIGESKLRKEEGIILSDFRAG